VIGSVGSRRQTLAIVCPAQLEIRNFRPRIISGSSQPHRRKRSFEIRHAPPAKLRIKERVSRRGDSETAADIMASSLSIEEKRQCRQRFRSPVVAEDSASVGWTRQDAAWRKELYDGDGKKLITYPRAKPVT